MIRAAGAPVHGFFFCGRLGRYLGYYTVSASPSLIGAVTGHAGGLDPGIGTQSADDDHVDVLFRALRPAAQNYAGGWLARAPANSPSSGRGNQAPVFVQGGFLTLQQARGWKCIPSFKRDWQLDRHRLGKLPYDVFGTKDVFL